MKAYRITQWDECHENHEGRKYQRLSWYAKPNSFEGVSFRLLLKQEDKNDLYAGWCLLLDMASKGPRGQRGWLVRNGKPLSPLHLELLTGFAQGLFERALEFFSKPEIGWLTQEDYPPSPGVAGESPGNLPEPPAGAGKPPGYSTVPVPNKTGTEVQKAPTDKNIARAREEETAGGKNAVLASRTQFAALQRQVKDLEQRADELTDEDRKILQQKQALLRRLGEKQARGEF